MTERMALAEGCMVNAIDANAWSEPLGKPWVMRGSRLLPTYRAASLQSGSPPGVDDL
jgi:hypothetical protein